MSANKKYPTTVETFTVKHPELPLSLFFDIKTTTLGKYSFKDQQMPEAPKTCPRCKSITRETFSLRPENWPKGRGYVVCNCCDWEQKDLKVENSVDIVSRNAE